MVQAGRRCVEEASTAMSRKRRRQNQESDIERRAVRAQRLVQLGELSSGRQALEGTRVKSDALGADQPSTSSATTKRAIARRFGGVSSHQSIRVGRNEILPQSEVTQERRTGRTIRNDRRTPSSVCSGWPIRLQQQASHKKWWMCCDWEESQLSKNLHEA